MQKSDWASDHRGRLQQPVENSAKLIHETRTENRFKRLKDTALVF